MRVVRMRQMFYKAIDVLVIIGCYELGGYIYRLLQG